MLPERLSVALACFTTIILVYLAALNRWNFETTMVSVLIGIFASLVLGRFFGMLSARELAQALVDEEEAKQHLPPAKESSK